jgi:hypothetical protein
VLYSLKISPSGGWYFFAGLDRLVTPEQRLEAADAKTIDLFVPGIPVQPDVHTLKGRA